MHCSNVLCEAYIVMNLRENRLDHRIFTSKKRGDLKLKLGLKLGRIILRKIKLKFHNDLFSSQTFLKTPLATYPASLPTLIINVVTML